MKLKSLKPDFCSIFAVAGIAALLFGVWELSHACAWIVGGLLLVCTSILVSAGRERRKKMECNT